MAPGDRRRYPTEALSGVRRFVSRVDQQSEEELHKEANKVLGTGHRSVPAGLWFPGLLDSGEAGDGGPVQTLAQVR